MPDKLCIFFYFKSIGRIRHHGRLVATAEALEPVNDHCFIAQIVPLLLQRTSVKSATCVKRSQLRRNHAHTMVITSFRLYIHILMLHRHQHQF